MARPSNSFLGAIVLGVITGGTSYLILKHSLIQNTLNNTVLSHVSLKKSIFSALLGTFSHIILDAPLYNDMNPFLPIMGNPLFGVVYPTVPYVICSISFILGLVVLLVRFRSWEQFIDKFDVRQLMRKQAVLLLIVIVGMSIILLPLVLFFLTPPIDDVVSFNWTDTTHGAEVYISLTMDALWVTNYSRKITFFFAVTNIATASYDNSYIILNRVSIDPSYINATWSPFKQLSEKDAWSADWRFTPIANDTILRSMGIAKDKRIHYSLPLKVNYTVVDSEDGEWQQLFLNSVSITIVGGKDAPETS